MNESKKAPESSKSQQNRIDEVGRIVLDTYNRLSGNGKPNANEFTVLSGFVVEITGPSGDSEIFPIAITTGTKCLGQSQLSQAKGRLISDSHAEVLARRAFIRYLLTECFLLANGVRLVKSLIEYDLYSRMFSLKDSVKIYLFISDSPCGDACIYQRTSDVLFTGAKLVDNATKSWVREENQEIGLVRTKSGRSDITDEHKTTSMSCSDKICKWQAVGLQGSLISQLIKPFSLHGLVIGNDRQACESAQIEGLRRSLIDRVGNLAISTMNLKIVPFSEFKNGKCNMEFEQSQSKSTDNNDKTAKSKLKPCGNSLNWIRNPSISVSSQGREALINNRLREVAGGTVEVTIAANGTLQGCTKRSFSESNDHSREISSRLTRMEISRLFAKVVGIVKDVSSDCHCQRISNEVNQMDEQRINKEYWHWKQLSSEYMERKNLFLSHEVFRNWIVDDPKDNGDFCVEIPSNQL